jgi:serine phosphatase RsbU (regulator of sigma subunit)
MRESYSGLRPYLRAQLLYLAISAIVASIFWAIGQTVNPLTILIYSLCIGNMTSIAAEKLQFLYSNRRFPYNVLAFLIVVVALLPPVYVISSTVVWLVARPSPETLSHYLLTGWKFPTVATIAFSLMVFFFHTMRDRLEQRNRELQKTLQLGTAQLEAHEQEFARALEIQRSLLPREIPQIAGYQLAAAWRPARTVSGDYFDVLKLGEQRLAMCVADVVGKGVAAALLMANVQAAVRAYAREASSPADLCAKVNRLLCESIAVGKFVTFLFGILDGETGRFSYCNAGHLNPIVVSQERAQRLETSGAVLGVFPGWEYFDGMVDLSRGDRLLLFTDGITEAEDSKESEFGEERLAELARRNCGCSAPELSSLLLGEVERHCDAHFQDDATLIVLAAN